MASTDATGEAKTHIGLATALSVVPSSQDVAGPSRRAGRRVTSVGLAALLSSAPAEADASMSRFSHASRTPNLG